MMRLLLLLTLPLYALDQLTKWLVLRNIPFDGQVTVIPDFFWFVHLGNTGAAFSMLRGNNSFFVGLSAVALVVVVILWKRGAFGRGMAAVGAALLLAGILGNLTDRLIHSHVIDFLLVDLHVKFANPWPAFNVADSCICVAAALFVISSFFEDRKAKALRSAE